MTGNMNGLQHCMLWRMRALGWSSRLLLSLIHISRLRNFPKVILIALVAIVPTAVIDIVSNENYMFFCAPPEGTFLEPLFLRFGGHCYRIVLAALLISLVFLLYLPFEFFRKKGFTKQR